MRAEGPRGAAARLRWAMIGAFLGTLSMADSPSRSILQRLAEGDARALGEFYDAHAGLAYGLALRILRERTEAEDAVQEAFVQVWRQAARYDATRGTPEAWLCAIVRTRAIDRLRRRVSRREQSDEPATAATAPPPEHESVLAVRKALSSLSADQRTALELAYYEGLTQSEIASRLNQPLGTIKTRIRTAMLRLREELGPS